MSENIQRSKGRSGAYKLDRGGAPAESGPFVGEVVNNVDPTRAGRLQVYIEDFSGPDKNDKSLWRTVKYLSPFYGNTQQYGTSQGDGSYVGNKHSYGMWFTTPDIGAKVLCFFASGDPDQGYYIGCIPEPGLAHMVPAIAATSKFKVDSSTGQGQFFSKSKRLPTTEINDLNQSIDEDPRFFDKPKPIHSVIAGTLLQQGLLNDQVRGVIGSTSQRESPSNVYGVSTPGRPIWSGGLTDKDIQKKLQAGSVRPQDAIVVGRKGGHSFVMDDGDIGGADQLVRIRTATGHQIMMSDSGNSLHIIHANGQTWMEFGSEGTVDVYSTNSINLRSQGDINIHADRNININAGGRMNVYAAQSFALETSLLQLTGKQATTIYSQSYIGVKSDGSIALDSSKSGSWNGGSSMTLSAGCIALNSGNAPSVQPIPPIKRQKLNDVKFDQSQGWITNPGQIDTVVTRAPTHEPYPYHGKGTSAQSSLTTASPSTASTSVTRALNSTETGVATTSSGDTVPTSDTTTGDPTVDTTDTSSTADDTVTINEGDYVSADPVEPSIGSILPEEVIGLFAAAIKESGQVYDEVGPNGEVGQFATTPIQLEATGYLKPGINEFYLGDGKVTAHQVLSAPSVWTGKDGVTSLAVLLNNRQLQNIIQTTLYQQSLIALTNAGIIAGTEDANVVGPLVQATAKYGITAIQSWVNGQYVSNIENIKRTVRSARYAIRLVQQKLNDAAIGVTPDGEGSSDTTQRTALDDAVNAVINNKKVTG
jgi:hypothetical protein